MSGFTLFGGRASESELSEVSEVSERREVRSSMPSSEVSSGCLDVERWNSLLVTKQYLST